MKKAPAGGGSNGARPAYMIVAEETGCMTEFDDDDRELPDPSDMDPEGEDEFEVGDPCPNCKRAVYEDAERCPHCGHLIGPDAAGKPPWFLVLIAICLLVLIIGYMYYW